MSHILQEPHTQVRQWIVIRELEAGRARQRPGQKDEMGGKEPSII